MDIKNSKTDKIIVVGDRLLIKPSSQENVTQSGLILPPGIQEKETVQSGYVIKAGPGYPIPNIEPDEPWKPQSDSIKYIPLQIHEGDLAVFLQKYSYEITFGGEKYLIVSQSHILLVIREDY